VREDEPGWRCPETPAEMPQAAPPPLGALCGAAGGCRMCRSVREKEVRVESNAPQVGGDKVQT